MNEPMILLTKIFEFDSAHRLNDYDGKCKNIHGHTYKLEVTIAGIRDENGIVMDFYDLNALINEKILDEIDHQYLNEIFDFNPTCENLGIWIWETLIDDIEDDDIKLEKIVLWENTRSYITLTREEMV
jgi:6-pyruvoyltetrahydropterin/6-carboxytetrahydropterin synthase